MLRLENISKRFGPHTAVEIPALNIHQGEFFTFVGPSGCGKSTTLNLIAGLESPDSGSIRLGDLPLNDLPPHRRNVAFVFQSYALYPHRTVFRNLSFPLEIAGLASAEIRSRVEHTASLLGLTPLLQKLPRQLSGGERQRVALGRAIVRQPALFLLDEPLSNLDAPLRAAMRTELKRLHARLGITFLYVTHDQEEALSLSDRIAMMHAGKILQIGTPRDLYDRPASRPVAAFFGSPPMNLLDAQLSPDSAALRIGELLLPLPPSPSPLPKKLTVGIRPEHLLIEHTPAPGAWPARISLLEPHGAQTHIELSVGNLRLTAVTLAGAFNSDRPATPLHLGDSLFLRLPAHHLHFFDADSGARL